MVEAVLSAIDANSSSHVLELFCGLGNFSLPLARHVASVTAIEGDTELLERARNNATQNKISNVNYLYANLMEDTRTLPWWKDNHYERVFLDPPRSGAFEVLPNIARLGVERIVYVSCNPATLARDAGYLVNECGYELLEAGIMDMFPHTAHVESIAVFIRK
jgi:23S rRNA (uracil1939-C5)-methyltransferase